MRSSHSLAWLSPHLALIDSREIVIALRWRSQKRMRTSQVAVALQEARTFTAVGRIYAMPCRVTREHS
eukprot:354879-Chlamydomonas_euryale.AAC.4